MSRAEQEYSWSFSTPIEGPDRDPSFQWAPNSENKPANLHQPLTAATALADCGDDVECLRRWAEHYKVLWRAEEKLNAYAKRQLTQAQAEADGFFSAMGAAWSMLMDREYKNATAVLEAAIEKGQTPERAKRMAVPGLFE